MIHRPMRYTIGTFVLALSPLMLASAAATALAAESHPITTAALLDDMVDLAAMAEFPSPPYTCKQFSSYDRESKSPEDAKSWFANRDAGQFLRVDQRGGRKEFVMMDAAGPGAVVRIWSANPSGTIRVYLDGADTPVLETPMGDLLGGRFPGLPRPIAGECSKGWNLYFPIPYAKSCRITSDADKFYYHVNYRTYPSGTQVESFQLEQLQSLSEPIAKVAARLADPLATPDKLGGSSEAFEFELPPGSRDRQEFSGPKAISRSVVRIQAADLEAALRGLVVKVQFDGEPCIEAPLGDFFASAPGINPFATLPLGMTKDGQMICQWFMPFKDSAVVEVVNHSGQNVTLHGDVTLEDYAWTERSMHFHAKWRTQFDVPTRPMIDWNYLTVTGQGVFAGVAFAIDSPVKVWWGEGDEKIYVDGEKFPSHFGTGTEDYYGYAWGSPQLFSHAYHAQPRCDGPNNYGRTSLNRFHILDRVPFTKDFRFDMELWHWDEHCKVNLAVTAYWYARPGGSDGFGPIGDKDAIVRPMPPYTPPPGSDFYGPIDLPVSRVPAHLRRPSHRDARLMV